MKIIACDGLDRETVSDKLVATGITEPALGRVMVDALNAKKGGGWHYRLVSDDHKLYEREP